jgi:eukaryotic-like serine/threonine-protein kinase
VSDNLFSSADASAALPPEVPDLDLLRCVGRGGFGEVWLAVNRTTGRLRAVKLIALHGGAATDLAGREIVSLKYLESQVGMQHPNLLGIHHVGKTATHLFYIMDPADDASGQAASSDPGYRPATLAQRLEAGPLPAAECLCCTRQLLSGLAQLHAAGRVHRDVKPANCLFVSGQLKLADFGLLTAANPLVSRVGTLKYMPPDGRMDARADVYAAGMVVYEMLTGLPVESFPRLGDRARAIAETPMLCGLNRLLLHACQNDAHLRYRDASEMLAALDAPDPKMSARHARRRRVIFATSVAAILAVVALMLTFWLGRPPQVNVNFVTQPFEATIEVDGKLLLQPDGRPYATPCTAAGLTAGSHHTVFKHAGLRDLDAGEINFATVREVTARW